MRLTHICVETRGGYKTMLNTQYAYRMDFANGTIPRLAIDCGGNILNLYTGARFPCTIYDPRRDTVYVELNYEDGSTEVPYPWGHVDLGDLYQRLCHPELGYSQSMWQPPEQNAEETPAAPPKDEEQQG